MTQRLAPWHQVKTLRKGVLRPASSAISLIPSRRIEDIWPPLYWAYRDYIAHDTPFTLLRPTWRRRPPHICDWTRMKDHAVWHQLLLLPPHASVENWRLAVWWHSGCCRNLAIAHHQWMGMRLSSAAPASTALCLFLGTGMVTIVKVIMTYRLSLAIQMYHQ